MCNVSIFDRYVLITINYIIIFCFLGRCGPFKSLFVRENFYIYNKLRGCDPFSERILQIHTYLHDVSKMRMN